MRCGDCRSTGGPLAGGPCRLFVLPGERIGVYFSSLVYMCHLRTGFNFATPHLKPPQGKHKEAVPLSERAYSIHKEKLGENHHTTVGAHIILEHVRKRVCEQETD